MVERTFAWLNNCFRRFRVRYERLASTYYALCAIGCIMLCLRWVLK